MIAQLLSQHLLGGGGGHAAEVVFLRSDIQHHGVTHLGIVGHLHHLGQGDLVVFAFHLVDDDLAGQHPVALFFEVEAHIEIAEVLLFEGVFTDAQIKRASVALVALEQGFPQSGLHHLWRQLLLVADVVDQVAESGEKNESHRRG